MLEYEEQCTFVISGFIEIAREECTDVINYRLACRVEMYSAWNPGIYPYSGPPLAILCNKFFKKLRIEET